MQPSQPYNRAPIIEAILDLRVAVPDGITAAALGALHGEVRDEYPNAEPMLTGSVTLQFGSLLPLGSTQQHSGYKFRSQDGLRVFQATPQGFTFSRLRPYERWENFRDEARRLWEIYRNVCTPVTVTRVGLRYINRLELPLPLGDFKEYLRTVPEIGQEIDTGLGAFFMQVQLPQQDLDCMLIINEATAPQTDPTVLPVILDLDLARQHDWRSDDEDIWQYLEQLRVSKNRAFEACITDKARRLFA